MSKKTLNIRFSEWLTSKIDNGSSYTLAGISSGLNPTTVSDICRNKRDVRLSTFVALATAFDTDPGELLQELSK